MPSGQPWNPLYPDVAIVGEVNSVPAVSDTDSGEVAWMPAPADSHVQEFRFYDARKHSFLRRFGSGRSEIQVRFRPTAKQPVTQYSYYFDDATLGESIFEQLTSATHPGEVIHTELIRTGTPYRKTGG